MVRLKPAAPARQFVKSTWLPVDSDASVRVPCAWFLKLDSSKGACAARLRSRHKLGVMAIKIDLSRISILRRITQTRASRAVARASRGNRRSATLMIPRN